jgi:hypothetical protein
MFSGNRDFITSSENTLVPKSWRIGVPVLGALRPLIGHEVTASMAAVLARECPMDDLLRSKPDKDYSEPKCCKSDVIALPGSKGP